LLIETYRCDAVRRAQLTTAEAVCQRVHCGALLSSS
jgi:hypothetical protein